MQSVVQLLGCSPGLVQDSCFACLASHISDPWGSYMFADHGRSTLPVYDLCASLFPPALPKCAAFFDQFFVWSFWSSSALPRLVVLRCVLLSVLYCVVLCCVVIYLLFVILVCWLKISQFSCTFVARLNTTSRKADNGLISSTNSTMVRPTWQLATKGNPKILV